MAESSKSDWTEHTTPEGKKYFYNPKTGVSTWDKPDDLKTHAELAQASCPWTEYTTENGRKYYYNSVTQKSSWDAPSEFIAMKEATNEEKNKGSEEVKSETEKAAVPLKPTATTAKSASASAHPAARQAQPTTPVEIFKSLLRDYKITPSATWNSTMRAVIKDERYNALRTLPERKATFNEYIEETKTKEREERKRREETLGNDFFAMLREGNIDVGSTYRKAMNIFDRDPRWKAVEKEQHREDLFDDFVWELETKQREDERNNRERNIKAYHQLLDENVANASTQWRKFKEDAKDDPRFQALDKLDRLMMFEHRIRASEHSEAEEKRKERETQRRQNRKNREAFRLLLQQEYEAGRIDRSTRWKRFRRSLKDNPIYENMIGQPGSTPSELYGDFVEDLQQKHDESKKIIDRIMKEGNLTITGWMAEDQFLAAISTHPLYPNLDPRAASKIFSEMREQVERKEKKEKRKRERDMISMLKSRKDQITTNSVYDDQIRELLAEEPSFKAIPDDEERKAIFQHYVEQLKSRPVDYDSSSEEEGAVESESEDERDRKKRQKERRDKDRKDRKRRRHSSKEDEKHRKKRKERERERDKSKKQKKEKRRRDGSEEGELMGDHKGKEDGEMEE